MPNPTIDINTYEYEIPYIESVDIPLLADVLEIQGCQIPKDHAEKLVSDLTAVFLYDNVYYHADDIDEWLTPCAYKSQGNNGCHDPGCRVITALLGGISHQTNILNTHQYNYHTNKFNNNIVKLSQSTSILCGPTNPTAKKCKTCGFYNSQRVIDILAKVSNIRCMYCYRTSFEMCIGCDNIYSKDTMADGWFIVDYNEGKVCNKCLTSSSKCKCGRLFLNKKIFDNVCKFCIPNVIGDYHNKPTPKFHGVPGPWFGIEIEVEMKDGQEDLMNLIAYRFSKSNKITNLKKDSSIATGFEIVTEPLSLPYWTHDASNLRTGLRKLTRHCESWAVDNCGIHVHVGRDTFIGGNNHIAAYIYFVNHFKLFSSFIAERYNVKQSPFLDTSSKEKIIEVASLKTKIDRHTAVNVQSTIPTVETRIFKGNLKWERILKNIQFVHALQAYTKLHYAKWDDMSVKGFIEFVSKNQTTYPELHTFISKYKKEM